MTTFNRSPTLRPNIDALTSLRFFAALYVMLFHFGAGFAERAELSEFIVTFLHNGWFGVSTFFVLSGFILAYTYREGVAGPRSLFDFAVARVARLYPVYVLALIVALPLLASELEFWPAAKTLLLVQSWGSVESSAGNYWLTPAWSLSVETFFYVLFPSLMYALRRIGRVQAWIGIMVVAVLMVVLESPLLRPAMTPPTFFSWLTYVPLPIYRLPEFIYGVLLCKLFLSASGSSRPIQSSIVAVGVLLIFLLGVAQGPLLSVGTLLVGVLIYLLAKKADGFVTRIMSSRVLVALGGASYAIYLLHEPIREWVRVLIPSPTIGRLLYPFVVILVSLFVFYLYEQPARRLIRGVALASAARKHRDGPVVLLAEADDGGQDSCRVTEDFTLTTQEVEVKP